MRVRRSAEKVNGGGLTSRPAISLHKRDVFVGRAHGYCRDIDRTAASRMIISKVRTKKGPYRVPESNSGKTSQSLICE